MNYFVKICIIFLGIYYFGCASDPRFQVKSPYLYQVTKGSKSGYVFGSMHTGIHKDDLPKKFWSYVDQSQIVVAEADMSDEDALKKLAETISDRMLRKESEPLALSHFTKSEAMQISQRLKPTDIKLLDQLNPFGIYNLLISSEVSKFDSENSEVTRSEAVRTIDKFSLDNGIVEYATDKGKYFDKLDSIESESFISCITGTDEQNVQTIKKFLSDARPFLQTKIRRYLKLADDYRNARSSEIIQELKEAPNCLLASRNKQWMFKVKSILEYYEHPLFVVGVGHLIDKKDSLLDLMKADGYTIELVKFP